MTISTFDELDASIKAYIDTKTAELDASIKAYLDGKFSTADAALVSYLAALQTASTAATQYAAIIAAISASETNITDGVTQSGAEITSSVSQIDAGVQDTAAALLSVGLPAPTRRGRYFVKADGP